MDCGIRSAVRTAARMSLFHAARPPRVSCLARYAVPFRSVGSLSSVRHSEHFHLTSHRARLADSSKDCAEGAARNPVGSSDGSDVGYVTGIIFHFKRSAELWSRVDADTLGRDRRKDVLGPQPASLDAAFRASRNSFQVRSIFSFGGLFMASQRSSRRGALKAPTRSTVRPASAALPRSRLSDQNAGCVASTAPQTRSDIDRL